MRLSFTTTSLSSLFYGMFLIIGTQTICVLSSRDVTASRARIVMLAVTAVMLASSTAVWAIHDMYYYPAELSVLGIDHDSPFELFQRLWVVLFFLTRLNYLLSDCVLIWRAWVLWSHNRFIRCLLLLCMLGSFGAAATEASLNVAEDFRQGLIGPSVGERSLILYVPLLLTNVIATSLIALRAWLFRQRIKEVLRADVLKSRVERVLVLLVESGLVYCVLWVIYTVSQFAPAGLVYFDGVMGMVMPHISGIYPITIILLVSTSRSQCDSTLSTPTLTGPIVFATRPNHVSKDSSEDAGDPSRLSPREGVQSLKD